MIDRTNVLSMTKQAAALGISRGKVYYLPKPTSNDEPKMMKWMEQLHMELPLGLL